MQLGIILWIDSVVFYADNLCNENSSGRCVGKSRREMEVDRIHGSIYNREQCLLVKGVAL